MFEKYANGKEFMDDLHVTYGLVRGCELAEEYLRISREIAKNAEPDEVKFCAELEEALNRLNNY